MNNKWIFNVVFYLFCFYILSSTIYRLGFTAPPAVGTEGYADYRRGVLILSIGIGLLVLIPNLLIEYMLGKWSRQA